MRKSLRWKLLGWYAVILLALSGVFAALSYTNLRRSIEQDVDGELRAQATALADVIVAVEHGLFQVELSREQVEYFQTEGDRASHYAIWKASGELIDASHPALPLQFPTARGSRDRDQHRELSVRGPGETWVLVGKDIRREEQQLRRLGVTAAGVGLVAMLLMLAGGWFLTGRALAPIDRISRAASGISASNLSERIDASRMETELAGLANTINEAFDRLEQAFQQQSRFTADASHELRTPLSIILSHAELALKGVRSPTEYRDALVTIRRGGLRMKSVVEGLLTLARADAGRIQLHLVELDLGQLVEETCSLLQPLAFEKQVVIVQRMVFVFVFGDRDRLSEAIANLLANAIQYNDSGGRVDVSLQVNRMHAELRISDTGRGIPEADRQAIFERFYRVDEARSQAVGGSGLGLAITKWIIDSHGGSIEYEAGARGGAIFIVKLLDSRQTVLPHESLSVERQMTLAESERYPPGSLAPGAAGRFTHPGDG